jgi:hypothetical protein
MLVKLKFKVMKTKIKSMMVSSLAIASLALTTSCEKDFMGSESNTKYAGIINVDNDGTTLFMHSNTLNAFVETNALTDTELVVLQKMKDEEKLARDVYSALNVKWGSNIFSRISHAENNHLTAIVYLLKYYNESDTLISDAGVFANAEVLSLYNTLVTNGSVSLEEAYKTGALIEEMDINDLRIALTGTTNANINMVFENLERGSRNHLRAFNRQLTSIGATYTPVYLTQDEYTIIVNAPMEKGKKYRMNGNGNGNGKHQGNGSRKGSGGNGQGMQGDGSCNN